MGQFFRAIRHRAAIFCLCMLAILCCAGCAKEKAGEPVPEDLTGQSFVYDELETGEGSALYTLRFTKDQYYLYRDSGIGVLSSGNLESSADGSLTFCGDNGDFQGSFNGGAFEEPSVTIKYEGRTLEMAPATDTSEYVYLSYLGVYEGALGGKNAVLVLERWFEYYLYCDGVLYRGNYEIFNDRTIRFTPYEGDVFTGTVEYPSDTEFDLGCVTFSVKMKVDGKKSEGSFRLAQAQDSYEAAHAMGAYTLSVYTDNLFTIKGVDGFLKCLGVLKENGNEGVAEYFPRKITGEVEEGDTFQVAYTHQDDILYFPETTPFLPRSGNLDEETGIGSYWGAGTKLEFIHTEETGKNLSEGIEFVSQTIEGAVSGGNFPDEIRGLDQVMPSKGTAKPLVLLIDFPDYHRPRHVTADTVEKSLFSLEQEDSLAAYYYRSSYGNLVIDGTVLGWYRTEQERGKYESDKEIMAEALNHYIDQGIQLSDYDGDGDGEIDSLYVLWAGNLTAEGGIWDAAYRSTWEQSPSEWDCRVTGYIFVPGTTVWSSVPPLVCNTNSLIHETGHLLGLNDYYSYDTSSRSEYSDEMGAYTGGALEGGLGGMDMMDANIGDHNAFSKWLLGWMEPTVVSYEDIQSLDGQSYELRPSSLAGDALFIKLKDSDDLYTELLVIESVAPVGNASEYTRLKNPVVRVMHVDASVAQEGMSGNWRGYGFAYDNSYTSTKFISLLEADGEDEFLNYIPAEGESKPSYSEADYFVQGDRIAPDTYPNTNGYDRLGNATISTGLCIEVKEIREDGMAVIGLSYQEAGESLQVTSISPDPCSVPYTQGEAGTLPVGTKKICFTYNLPLAAAGQLERVRVFSDQQQVSGVQASIEGNQLIVTLENGTEAKRSYTVVIPRGILSAAKDPQILNNSNGIYGFAP